MCGVPLLATVIVTMCLPITIDSATSSIERSSTIQVMMKTLKQFHNMRDLVANHLVTITNLSTSGEPWVCRTRCHHSTLCVCVCVCVSVCLFVCPLITASSTSILVEEGVVHAVCRAVREHIEDQELMDAGCSALWSLSLSGQCSWLAVFRWYSTALSTTWKAMVLNHVPLGCD